MRVLVTGGKGQLGSKVVELLSGMSDFEVFAADLPELDITEETTLRAAVGSFRPDWIVNCAAYTDVEKAEREPEKAYLVNCGAVKLLAEAAAAHAARLLHISTDYVFSGIFTRTAPRPYTEESLPGPISVYGASKLAGEVCLRGGEACPLVLRTSWLYGGPGRNFLGTMLRAGGDAIKGGRALRVVEDQIGTPTDVWSLALQVERLLSEDVRGIVHASSQGQTSWFEFARAVFRRAGMEVRVEPILTSQYPARARRPLYSVLENRRLQELGLNILPHWEEGLFRAMARLGIEG